MIRLRFVVFMAAFCLAPRFAAAGQVTWTNTADGDWSTGSNWSTGAVPGVSDTVVIALSSTFTVTLDTTVTVAALTIGSSSGIQTLAVSGTSFILTVSGKLTFGGNGILDMYNSTINADTVDNQGVLELRTSSKLLSKVDNNGQLIIVSSGNEITGPLTNAVGDTVSLGGGSSWGGDLTIDSMFTNLGVLELTNATSGYSATLTVTNATDTLVNSGTINILSGVGGGSRTIKANLDNQGTFAVTHATLLNKTHGYYTNSGNMTLGADLTLSSVDSFYNAGTISLVGGDLTMTMYTNNAQYRLVNSGTVDIAAAQTFSMTYGTFVHQGSATL